MGFISLRIVTGGFGRISPALVTPAGLWIVRALVLVALTLSFSYLFNAKESADRRAALPAAIARGLLYLGAGAVVLVDVPEVNLLGLITAAAVAMDLALELRVRATYGDLVALRRLEKPDHADDLVAELRAHGVPAVAQGAFHRTLLHFFGPFVPIDVLVPGPPASGGPA